MKKLTDRKIKLCLVSSSGGHLVKLFQLKPWWSKYERFWVVRDDVLTKDLLKGEQYYFGYFPENRNLLNAVKNLILAGRILRYEKPQVVFSMGAGIAPPYLYMAKLMGIKTIFMETFICIPIATLSGRLVYPIADHFFVQNQVLQKQYPKAIYAGKVI
jgi:beta-1,4-N-acetylglucosaminyltransferase